MALVLARPMRSLGLKSGKDQKRGPGIYRETATFSRSVGRWQAGHQIEVRRVSTHNATTVLKPPVAFRLGSLSGKRITSIESTFFTTLSSLSKT